MYLNTRYVQNNNSYDTCIHSYVNRYVERSQRNSKMLENVLFCELDIDGK